MLRLLLLTSVATGALLIACGGSDSAPQATSETAAVIEAAEQAITDTGDAPATVAETDDTAAPVEEYDRAPAAADAVDEPDPEPVVVAIANDAAPPSVVPDRPGGASGFTHFVFEQIGGEITTTLVEGPSGEQVRAAVSFPQLQALAESDAQLPPELQLTRAELGTLVEQLGAVRDGVLRYQDISVALADGYVQSTDVVPNMGAHFNHDGRIRDGVLNFDEPEILIYELDEAQEWELVGTSFVLPYQLVGQDHPAGFAGLLDNWHMHYSLCVGTQINSRSADAASCVAGGGIFVPAYGWMIHAWVLDDNPMGVFSMWNPNVPPTLTTAEIQQPRDASSDPHPHPDGTVHPHVPDAPEDAVVVNIQNFHHATLEIEEGQTVIWINVDGVPHTITAGQNGSANGGFDSLVLGSGQSYTHLFNRVGEFEFTCTLHPQMNGTIIVVPRST